MKLNVSIEEIFKQLNITIYKIKDNTYVMNDISFNTRKDIVFSPPANLKFEGGDIEYI